MGRPTDWHVLDLDKDPTPGDPTQVDALARRLKDFADDVGDALRSVKGLKGDSAVQSWTGLAAEEYRSQFDGIPGELEKLERSYRLCGDALAAFWPKLQQAQGDADRALEQGRQAKADLATAQSNLDSANDWVKRANDQAKKYQEDPKPNTPPPSDAEVKAASRNATNAAGAQRDAAAAVDSAQGRLDAAKQLAADARKLRDDEAHKAKSAIDEASDAGIRNKKWYEKAVHWVVDHWDEIVAVCKVVVAVLGVIVMIVGGPLAWLVLAAALVVLADTLIKYAQGKASLWDVAFAALDCIPGFKGITTAGGLLKMAKGGLKGMKGGLDNVASALRRGGKNARETSVPMSKKTCETDPVDVVSGDMVMKQDDLVLPGLLPLVLERAHISSYRDGRWFGRSWTSTLDQRLEIYDEGVSFITDDGMILHYPVPAPDEPTLPVEGPRWPMTWDGNAGGEIRIGKPEAGQTLHFDPAGPKLPGGADRALELPLRALTDRNANRIDFDYADTGVITQVRHSGGYRLGIETSGHQITAVRMLATGEVVVRYGYDSDGNLAEVVNSSGLPLRFAYDKRGRITEWHDRNGTDYRYEYDEDGRCVRTAGTDGFLSGSFVYDTENRRTVFTDALGHSKTYEYNAEFQVVRQTDALGAVTTSTWDRYDRLLSRTDPLGRTTRRTYDADGNLVAVTRPDGTATTAEYSDLHQPVSLACSDGAVWAFTYDEAGNRTSVTDPSGATTTYAYGAHGRLTGVTDALGGTRTISTDEAGLPVAVTDSTGATTRYSRDAYGRLSTLTGPTGDTTRFGWTPEGRPSFRALPDGSTERWVYDGEGNLVEHQDLAGHTTRFEATHFDLPSARIGPDGTRLEYAYDRQLRLTAVTNPQGLTWSYEYDPVGNLIRETDFDGRVLSYGYDAAGQLVERTNGARETTRFTRDLLGRTVERRSHDSVTTIEYDAAGRIVRAENAHAVLSYERDALGRVLAETCNGRTATNTYDVLGRRIACTTASGTTSTWDWAAGHRLSALHTAGRTMDFAYDEVGREIERDLGIGVTLGKSWDAANRLIAQTLTDQASGSGLLHRGYTYRADGNLTAVEDSAAGDRVFDLDAAGRVAAIRAADWQETYAYDSAGNLTGTTGPAQPEDTAGEAAYTGTLVKRAGRTRYEYDDQGRIVRRSRKLLSGGSRAWTYTWDSDDRLTGVTTPDGTSWRYLYDPLGRRIAKQRLDGDGTVREQTDFSWDGSRLAEQTGPGRRTTVWHWQPGTHRPLAQTDRVPLEGAGQEEYDERFYAIVTDLVGTPTELVGEDGAIAWRGRTTLWGAALPADPGGTGQAADCPLRFPGQYRDAESGLHYNLHRYYDPETGRYQSADRLGLLPADDHHAYIRNPLTWSDPLGLAPCWDMSVVDAKYDKHVLGEGKRPGEGPDMPEYQDEIDGVDGFDRYMQDAQNLMDGPCPPNVREVTRAHDGARLRMDQEGRIAIEQNGKITNFFRPDNPAQYMEDESLR